MTPELVLAIDACATDSAALVVQIVKKVAQVVKLKTKCRILGRDAILLKTLLDNNRSAIASFQMLDRILACLRAIDGFVTACQKFNVGERVLEVVFKGRFPKLQRECRALREMFCFEATVILLERQDTGQKDVTAAQKKLLHGQQTQREILQELGRKQNELQASLARSRPTFGAAKLSGLSHDFTPGKDFQWSSDGFTEDGTLDGVGQVQCLPLVVGIATNSYLDIYKGIQAGAYVRRVFGVLLDQQNYFAIMEPTHDQITLAQWCKASAGEDILSGLRLSFGISKSIAWMHKAELLTKTLTDQNILVYVRKGGQVCPLLTDLENSRHFLQRTAGKAYDVRYEAPEYQITGQHSIYTDVWLLGILVWQCISGCPPFGTLEEETAPEGPSAKDLREKLRDLKFNSTRGPLSHPSSSATVIVRSVYNLCQQCCNPESMLRPTSAAAAQRLQDLLFTAIDQGVTPQNEVSMIDISETPAEAPHGKQAYQHTLAFEATLLTEIQSARSKNSTSKYVQHEPDPPISPEDFASYVHDELEDDQERLPTKSFLIGAALWWQLVPEYFETEVSHEESSEFALNDKYIRAKTCLDYLDYAATSGYKEAYFEISRAHASLYHLHKDAFEQLQQKIGIHR